jgi:hypothetical protein
MPWSDRFPRIEYFPGAVKFRVPGSRYAIKIMLKKCIE